MATRYYIGVVERGTDNWGISFPSFPGVISLGDTFSEVLENGKDALATAVQHYREKGMDLPPDFNEDPQAERPPSADYQNPSIVLLAIEDHYKVLRINVSMDEDLVARLDRLADRENTSRSSLLARGAKRILEEARRTAELSR